MIRLTVSFETREEKENLISDISKLDHYKIKSPIKKEYPAKGKSLYRRIYIDLSEK